MRLIGLIAFAWGCASTATALTIGWLMRTLGACEPVAGPAPRRLKVTDDDGTWFAQIPVDLLRDGDPELDRRIHLLEQEFTP